MIQSFFVWLLGPDLTMILAILGFFLGLMSSLVCMVQKLERDRNARK
jgi:hypothetical protein